MTPETTRGETKRPVNLGAEKWVGVEVPVLDHGFIYLVDYMGGDPDIARAARVSYGQGTKTVREDEALIRYLLRHNHTSPFEMVECKFHIKLPIFVARQWIRHRTASVNEYSARYSILSDEFYIPEPEVMGIQSKSNRQGREETVDYAQAQKIQQLLTADSLHAYEDYRFLLNDDGTGKPVDPDRGMLARELARMGLTLNYYTQWYWKIDLHNLLHFLELRMDPHAQHEIRVYANKMGEIMKEAVPQTWGAFRDYRLDSVRFSKIEMAIITSIIGKLGVSLNEEAVVNMGKELGLTNNWETQEFIAKLKANGLLK